jgi:hypothetical protein
MCGWQAGEKFLYVFKSGPIGPLPPGFGAALPLRSRRSPARRRAEAVAVRAHVTVSRGQPPIHSEH